MFTEPCGIIFDLDGTLIDTLDDIALSVNELLAALGSPPLAGERICSFVGEGLANLIRQASGQHDPNAIADLVARYRPIYRRRMFDHARLYPGIADALDALTAAGHPFGILSNKSHDFTLPFVERMLARWSWIDVRGQQPDGPRKPDPHQAFQLAAAMQRRPEQLVFVGDSGVDVQTARNAGMASIGVTWGYRGRAELAAAGATSIIEYPGQLPPAVNAVQTRS